MYRAVGQLVVPDEALRQTSLRAFEHVWPVMQQRMRAELKRERWVTLAMGGLATLSYVSVLALLGFRNRR